MLGYPHPYDKHTELRKGEFRAKIAEYNDELTGFDKALHELDPSTFHYGGNAYYIRTKWAPQNGYEVVELPHAKSPTPSPEITDERE